MGIYDGDARDVATVSHLWPQGGQVMTGPSVSLSTS